MSKPEGPGSRLKTNLPFQLQILITKCSLRGGLTSLRDLPGFRTKAVMNML